MSSTNQLICLHRQLPIPKYAKDNRKLREITFHPDQKQRPNHRTFAMEKNSSHRKPMLQVVFRFSREIFILSGRRYIFLKFYGFPSESIVVKWRYLLL